MAVMRRPVRPVAIRLSRSVGCAILVCISVVSAPGIARAATTAPLWAPLHTGHIRVTDQNAASIAKTYRTLTINDGQLGGLLPQMRTANHALRVFVYVKGTRLITSTPSSYPASWFARDAHGKPVLDGLYSDEYVMDPSDPGWRSHIASVCAAVVRSNAADGCYLDGMGLFARDRVAAPIINRSTGKPWTYGEWIAATSGEAQAVQTSTGHPTVVNNAGNGTYWFGREAALYGVTGGVATSPLGMGVFGVCSEGFVWQDTNTAEWLLDVRMIETSHQLAITKTSSPTVRLYALATFLLAEGNGSQIAIYPKGESPVPSDPVFHLPIGAPTGGRTKLSSGVYSRFFSNGRALVNPTTAARTVSLGGTYRTSAGTLVTSLRLAPATGEILTRP
jgi:putative glycosyl hydrolase-like family 15 (GHL15) protein